MKNNLIIITIMAITVFACKKVEDSSNPTINITSPAPNQMVMDDSVLVAFTVTDEDLHGYEYLIINTTANDTLFEGGEHTHGNMSFSEKFAIPTPAEFRLEVAGEDHNGNTSTKSVNFHTM